GGRIEAEDVDAALVVDDVDVVGARNPVRRRRRAAHGLEVADLRDGAGAGVDRQEPRAVLVPAGGDEIVAAVTGRDVLADGEPVTGASERVDRGVAVAVAALNRTQDVDLPHRPALVEPDQGPRREGAAAAAAPGREVRLSF